ncbi:MAG TPA: hypothetical protein VJ777_19300 [Mycobacterium sp.]|nr:hypothetical protein [Mycobacterium sp.]
MSGAERVARARERAQRHPSPLPAVSSRNPLLAAGESVLEAIWCGPLAMDEDGWQRALASAEAPF